MSYPYDQYLAGVTATVTDPHSQAIAQALRNGAGFGIATTALQALDIVKNGGFVPIVLFDPRAPITGR